MIVADRSQQICADGIEPPLNGLQPLVLNQYTMHSFPELYLTETYLGAFRPPKGGFEPTHPELGLPGLAPDAEGYEPPVLAT